VIDETLLRRITVNPEIFGGQPIIRGMRISVELILSLLAQGETPETILTDYPILISVNPKVENLLLQKGEAQIGKHKTPR